MAIEPQALIDQFPILYHMAAEGSWSSIERHGLLSTSALLDLYQISGHQRVLLEDCHRSSCTDVSHPTHGKATIRDQKPMSDKRLIKLLTGGLSPKDWYRILNGKVFFWLSEDRLDRLRNTKGYKEHRQTIIKTSTAELVAKHSSKILLSPINSGCTWPSPAERGIHTFSTFAAYPYSTRLRKAGRNNAVVELTVDYAVPDIKDLVLSVEEHGGGKPGQILFQR